MQYTYDFKPEATKNMSIVKTNFYRNKNKNYEGRKLKSYLVSRWQYIIGNELLNSCNNY